MKKITIYFTLIISLFLGMNVAFGQATLPVTTTTISSTALPTGFSQTGLATDYAGPKLKFDTQNDELVLFFYEIPKTLTFDLGTNNNFTTSAFPIGYIFTVKESVDGISYTTLATYTETNTKGTQTITGINSNSRYIKWIYTFKPSGFNSALWNINLTAVNDMDSEVGAGTQPANTTIASIIDTDSEAAPVFTMVVADWSTSDGLDTKITNIRIKPHTTTNTADWTDTIQGFVIYDDNLVEYVPTTTTITDAYIDFTFNSGILNVTDGSIKTLNFDVFLNTSNIVDNSILSFMVDSTNHGFTTNFTGSGFVNSFTAFNSNDFTVTVDATELQFTQQPANVDVQATMIPAVTVAYTDINGNVDRDYTGGSPALTATGATLNAAMNTAGTLLNGVLTFNDVEFDTLGTGVTLTVTDTNLTNTTVTSTTFDVTGEQEIDLEGANNGFTIVNGNTLPDEDHDTLFGTISTAGATSTQTYTIYNLGVLDLVLTDPSPYITIAGTNAADFSVSLAPTTPITGSSTTNFSITFNPSASGLRTAVVQIQSNDTDEGSFAFAIEGTGYNPCENLYISEYAQKTTGNYIEIYNPNNTDMDMANFQIWKGTDGGSWPTVGSTDIITLSGILASGNVYVIAKDASEVLYANKYDVNVMSFDGNDNIGLAWNGGSGTTFTLIDSVGDNQGNPGTGWNVAGITDATVGHTLIRKPTVENSNIDWLTSAGTDVFNSEWGVLAYTTITQLHHVSNCQQIPLMAVVGHLPGVGNDELVIHEGLAGPQTPKASNYTLFEDSQVGGTTVSHTFRIYNAGNTNLNLNGSPIVDIVGVNTSDFTVTTNPTTPVTANNGFTDFIIEFNPTTIGIKTATVNIANDNPFENPYTFTIQGTGFTPCNDLFFSKYGEGGASNKYLEIYNPLNTAIDLSNYSIVIYINGNTTVSNTLTLSGTIAANSTYIIEDSSATIPAIHTIANLTTNSTVMNFNGDDAIALVKSGSNIDIIGQIGYDPGSAWSNNGVSTTDQTLFRKISVQNGDSNGANIFDPSQEWIALPKDFDNFYGQHNSSCTGSCTDTVIWNGTWSNGTGPTMNSIAIIIDDYTGTGFNSCKTELSTGKTLTINNASTLNVFENITNNGTIVIENESSIVQSNSINTNNGSGIYKIHKTTPTYASYDYTYWSSPLSIETFDNVFTANIAPGQGSRIYSFNTANFNDSDGDTFDDNNDDWNLVDFSLPMTPGKGYIVMGTGTSLFPLTNPLTFTNQTQSVIFDKGIINNGDINVTLSLDGYTYSGLPATDYSSSNTEANLIGNPYPSAIDITKLSSQIYDVTTNSTGILEGTFYFWTHDDPIGSGANAGPDVYNFNNDDYSTVTIDNAGNFSATASSNQVGTGGITASQFVASGQGFFANAKSAGTMQFTNSMRVSGNNNNFLRPATTIALDRVWLNLTNTNNTIFRQILVGFHDGATDGFANGQDGARMENGSNTDFYSLIPNETNRFAIQNLGTFNDTKTINLGLEIIQDDTYEINIDHVLGVFANNQTVYLEDTVTNTIHDLSNNGAYQFTATIGDQIDSRFILRFTTTALGIADNNTVNTKLIIAKTNTDITLSTSNKSIIKTVRIYNVIGQELGAYNNSSTQMQISMQNIAIGTVLLVKATLENGTMITKKVIK